MLSLDPATAGREPVSVTSFVRQAACDLLHDATLVEQRLSQSGDEEGCYEALAAALDRCLTKLAGLELWGPQNRLPSSELWSIAGRVLSRGWLQERARTKPRGYAGDYEMLARIYESARCGDPLGRLFDRYFQEQAAPRAVRHRMKMIADWIVDEIRSGKSKVAVVGSAFGSEVRDALLRLDPAQRQGVHVTLLDLDPAATDFARRQLGPLLAPRRLTAESVNLFRLAERPLAASLLGGAEVLFCPGLFDYLEEPAAATLLRVFYDKLAPGGQFTVFQFAPHNPTRAYMEWIANWYLIYRDEAQLKALVEAAGIPAAQAHFGAEPLGVDLFVEVRATREPCDDQRRRSPTDSPLV